MAWVERVSRTSFRVRYPREDGSLGSVSGFPTKAAAARHAADLEADVRSGRFLDPAAGRMTVGDWAAVWLPSLDIDVRTEEGYSGRLRCHILPRWGKVALADISGIEVAAWVKKLNSGGLAPATVASIKKLFTMMLGDAVHERLIAYNPVQPQRRGRKRHLPTPEKVWATPAQVLAVADQTAAVYGPCGAMMILTAAWTGARWGELAGLHRGRLHLDDAHLVIDPANGSLHESEAGRLWLGPPKTASSARTIVLPDFLVPLLRRHLETVKSEFVFVTPDGHWHRRSNFARRALRPAADGTRSTRPVAAAAGADAMGAGQPGLVLRPAAPGLTFHGLRHSHKTWMIADGLPEIVQSRRLGHVLHDKIQETYSHVAAELEHRLLESLDDRWNQAAAGSATSADRSRWRAPEVTVTLALAS